MSLATKAVRGAVWTIASSLGARLVGVVGTLVLTHFIAPEAYGEVMVAVLFTFTAKAFTSIGCGQYIVANPHMNTSGVVHASALHLGISIVGLVVLLAISPFLGPYFNAPNLMDYLPILVGIQALSLLGFAPEKLLVRDMRFRAVSITRALSEISYAGSAVFFAVLGWGGYAIVFGNLVRIIVMTTLYVSLVQRTKWLKKVQWDREQVRDIAQFGGPLWLNTCANFACRNWDTLLFSSLFGSSAMANYNLAYNLASIPSIHIGEHIGDVLLPSFTRLDKDARKKALVRSIGLMSLIIFPLAIGLGAIAESLVAALFDEKWQRVAPYLVLLSGLSVVRPISWIMESYLQSEKRTLELMLLGIAKIILLLGCMAGFGMISDLWACAGVGIAFGLDATAGMWVANRDISTTQSLRIVLAMCQKTAGPLLACVPMVLAVFAVRHYANLGNPVVEVIVECLAGAVVYIPAAFVFANATARDLLQLLREAFIRRQGTGRRS